MSKTEKKTVKKEENVAKKVAKPQGTQEKKRKMTTRVLAIALAVLMLASFTVIAVLGIMDIVGAGAHHGHVH
ncbi:MAG: hypothetical protein J6B60_01815 [Clostridia bacterium]|nr:hypothetical protein [Clostridia bacterium]